MVISTDVLQAQIEKVRPKVQELFESTDTVASMIKKGGEAEIISDKLYRIPLVTRRGGSFRMFNADGGDMGAGSGLSVTNLEAGYIYTDYVVDISLRAMGATAKPEQSTINAFAYNFKNAMKELQVIDDITFHGDGTGKLTNSAQATGTWSGGVTFTYTGGTPDTLGCAKLRPGMVVNIYDTTGTTVRQDAGANKEFIIAGVDYVNKVVYILGSPLSLVATDLLAIAGILTTPLTSFTSGWPLSGDSFRHGLYYFNDANPANYLLSQLKSNVIELLANNVNAGGALAHVHALVLQDQIINRRDESAYKGIMGLCHMSQRTAVNQIGISMSEWMRTKPTEKLIDVMPDNVQYSTTFPFAGVTLRIDKRQFKDRIDFIIPKLWGRSMFFETKFHEVQGRTVFEDRATTGNLKAGVHFILDQAFDWYCTDPGAQGYINGLTVPALY